MRLRALSAAAAASLLLTTSAGAATIFADGATLGLASGSATNWSSDLGLTDHFGVFPDSVNRGPGGTSPLRPEGSLFSGESVTNFTGPRVDFGGSTGVLTSRVTLDVAPAGRSMASSTTSASTPACRRSANTACSWAAR